MPAACSANTVPTAAVLAAAAAPYTGIATDTNAGEYGMTDQVGHGV